MLRIRRDCAPTEGEGRPLAAVSLITNHADIPSLNRSEHCVCPWAIVAVVVDDDNFEGCERSQCRYNFRDVGCDSIGLVKGRNNDRKIGLIQRPYEFKLKVYAASASNAAIRPTRLTSTRFPPCVATLSDGQDSAIPVLREGRRIILMTLRAVSVRRRAYSGDVCRLPFGWLSQQ